jgi:hypothetical protein
MRLPKIITPFALVLVLLPCLYCLYFQVKHQVIRWEMEEKLERDAVQTIVVPANEFRWYDEGREIVVNGKMFDVKSITQENGNYLITGLFDEDETQLHLALNKLQHSSDATDAELISELIFDQWTHPAEHNLELFAAIKLNCRITGSNGQLHTAFLSILTPPPRG